MFSERAKNQDKMSAEELLDEVIAGLQDGDPRDELIDDLLALKDLLREQN